MKINILDRAQRLSDANHEHAHRSLHFALSRFGDEIQTVTISVEDLNGPKGGVDTRCVLKAKLRRHGTTEVTQEGTSFGECIRLASPRLGRSVRRQLDRERKFDRQTVRRMEGTIPSAT